MKSAGSFIRHSHPHAYLKSGRVHQGYGFLTIISICSQRRTHSITFAEDSGFPLTYYINIADLISERYLEGAPESSDSSFNNGGGNGSYGWYIDAYGIVQAGNDDNGVGYNGNYP